MKDSNRAMLSAMADRLGPLLDRVVFVGGCATGLLVTDRTAPPIRTTEDVDDHASGVLLRVPKIGARTAPSGISPNRVECMILVDLVPTDLSSGDVVGLRDALGDHHALRVSSASFRASS